MFAKLEIMNNVIARHSATITSIGDDGRMTALMSTSESCGSCAAKSVCGSESSKEFELVVDRDDRAIGDEVTLVITRSMGFLAITLAYLLPVVIIIGSLLICEVLGIDELTSGLLTLGLVGLYFVFLRIFRRRIENQITITIE